MTRTNRARSEWTTFGRDLLLSMREMPRGQRTDGVTAQIRDAIRGGTLRAGLRLPSSRGLAADLGVSRGVIVAAYEQLIAEGYLDARRGSGTVVASIARSGAVADRSPRARPSPVRHNPGLPDLSLFPRADWLRAYRRALDSLPDADLRYGHPQGFLPLRDELAGYLGRVRGLRAQAEDIVIVTIHWGGNWGYEISPRQREFARSLIDECGVDLIHGHSSHHVKGMEVYRRKLILYGCGDLITDYEGISGHDSYRGDLGLMYFATLSRQGDLKALEMVPTQMKRFQLTRPTDAYTDWLLELLNRECKEAGLTFSKTDPNIYKLEM